MADKNPKDLVDKALKRALGETGEVPNRRGRPPEGGPMPDAKDLDPAETALAIQTAYFHDNEEELVAWADAIKNGGLDTAGLIELGFMFTKLQKGGEIFGALVKHLRIGTPQE